MSVNQSRGDKNEPAQYRRSGRSGNPSSQRNFSGGGGGKGGAGSVAGGSNTTAPPPSSSYYSGKSFKKVTGPNPNVNLDPSNSSTGGRTGQNGAHIQPPFKGTLDAPSTGATVKLIDISIQKGTPGLPKAPPDASRAFPLQFGSINPGVMNGMQVPARTNSAPPNLDEQKRAQARLDSLKATSFQNPPFSKDTGPVDQSNPSLKKKNNEPGSAAKARKPSGPPIPPISMQMPFHQPQLHLQFPGPMHLPVGNPPQQPVFVPGMPHHQGMIHQMGHPQLGNVGMGLGPQYPQQPQQHTGNFGGTGTRKTVKITHPDTHEELKLDKRTDGFANGGSTGPRLHPHGPAQSGPGPSFPVNYYPSSYNSGPVFYPSPGSNAVSQAPRLYSQVTIKPAISSPATHLNKDSETITDPFKERKNSGKKAESGSLDQFSQPCGQSSSVLSLETNKEVPETVNTDIPSASSSKCENNDGPKPEITGPKEQGQDDMDKNKEEPVNNNIDIKESFILDQKSPLVSVSEASLSLEVSDSTGSIDNKGKSIMAKWRRDKKELLENADAQGTNSDLYMAYKRPEEKKEIFLETVEGLSINSPKQETVDSLEKNEKLEPDDCEDVLDDSTPDPEMLNKKKYSRDFLLKISDQYTDLPEGFEIKPDISEVLTSNAAHREPHPSPGRAVDRSPGRKPSNVADDNKWSKGSRPAGQPGIRPGHGVLPIPSQGPQRNNSDSDRWQRAIGHQKGLFPSPHTPIMHKAEKKYEIGKITDEEQAKQRQLKGILNKLTPQNFEKLFDQVKQVKINNAGTLSGVISQIFDKALMEPTFVEMYANFCSRLAVELPHFSEDNQKITFKRLLLNKCQEEFERGEREEEEAKRAETKQTEEREEKRVKARRRMLGNIRLIGELYKKKMLTERTMHECIKKLLGQYQNTDEENQNTVEEDIEALCKLMSTIGEMIDHPKAKEHMDAYFDMMYKLSNNMKLSSRVRFMLKDVIDLRKNRWQQRRKIEGPKKIEEVHRDAAQERQAQSSRLARGPNQNVRRVQVQPVEFGPRGSVGGFRGLAPQRHSGLSVPVRPVGDEFIMLGPQGGLARGMSVRGPPLMGGPNGYGSVPERVDRVRPSSPPPRARVPTPPESGSSHKALNEDRLRDSSIEAIKEFYSARDEKEIGLCIKDLNAPSFYPSMISIWVTDSFERKDTERDSLAKLLVNLMKSQDGLLTPDSLLKGFESVLSTLEDAVNDAPKAAEFLGEMLARILLENIIPYKEMWRLIYEGGEEQGRLVEIGLAAEVVGVILEIIKSEKGDVFLNDLCAGISPRLENFRPANIKKSLRLDKFI